MMIVISLEIPQSCLLRHFASNLLGPKLVLCYSKPLLSFVSITSFSLFNQTILNL